jgi:hypothetical protein
LAVGRKRDAIDYIGVALERERGQSIEGAILGLALFQPVSHHFSMGSPILLVLTTLLACAGVPVDRPVGIATNQLKGDDQQPLAGRCPGFSSCLTLLKGSLTDKLKNFAHFSDLLTGRRVNPERLNDTFTKLCRAYRPE